MTRSKPEIIKQYGKLQRVSKVDPQARGRAFEDLVLDIFEEARLLVKRSYYTSDNKSEQIDGAIKLDGTVCLLEVKWVESGLAASELFSFIGKVENKFTGTLGLFLSKEPLSENFLNALRRGRRQSVMVMHGEDIDNLFSIDFKLKEYLAKLKEELSFDNILHYPTKEFLQGIQDRQKVDSTPASQAQEVTKAYREAIADERKENILDEIAARLDENERVELGKEIIGKFYSLSTETYASDWKARNLKVLLQEIFKLLKSSEQTSLTSEYYDHYSEGFKHRMLESLQDIFAPSYSKLDESKRKTIEKRLLSQWENAASDYDVENRLASATEPIFDHLLGKTQRKLLNLFADFVLSDRYSGYPQVELAKSALRQNVGTADDYVKAKINKEAASWLSDDWGAEDVEKVERWLSKDFRKIAPFVSFPLETYIHEELQRQFG